MKQRVALQVSFSLAFAGLVGCGGGGGAPAGSMTTPPGTGGAPGNTPAVAFTEDEVELITANLKQMDAKPWEDKSNKWGENPQAAILGQKFYFEPRYSSNGKVSCATCHNPEQGFQDSRAATSSGPDPTKYTGRHAPTVINAAHGSGRPETGCWQFWDGRADSQWAQALGPPENDVEMGGSRTKIALLIWDHYKDEFEALFNEPGKPAFRMALRDGSGAPIAPPSARPDNAEWMALGDDVKLAINDVYVKFGKAIAAYERKIVSRNARFDTYLADFLAGKRDSNVLTDDEKLGLKVFAGKGKCISCHRGPNFSDWKFHNIGESQLGSEAVKFEDVGREAGAVTVKTGGFKAYNCESEWSDHPNKAECPVALLGPPKAADKGAFKTPGLRDVTKTAPYMHTGRLKTLEEVVEHYDRGGGDAGTYVGTLDRDIVKLNLTAAEKAALVKFMKTLDGEPLPAALLTAPKLPGL
jgi:cytochrome c peroxidase